MSEPYIEQLADSLLARLDSDDPEQRRGAAFTALLSVARARPDTDNGNDPEMVAFRRHHGWVLPHAVEIS